MLKPYHIPIYKTDLIKWIKMHFGLSQSEAESYIKKYPQIAGNIYLRNNEILKKVEIINDK